MEKSLAKEFTKGIISENPSLRLVLGTCPTLAVTTSAINGFGMGISALVVLVCSNVVISALRKVIPDRVRIPAFITIIATFVTVIQMFIKAFLPSINDALGIYLPLIVVNCIILGRAEMFASKNSVLPSLLDGLGMGVGFTCTLVIMGSIRELLGCGTIFNIAVTKGHIEPMLIMIMAPGGFFVFGVLMALANKLAQKMGKEPVTEISCAACPNAANCPSFVQENGAAAKSGDCALSSKSETSAIGKPDKASFETDGSATDASATDKKGGEKE